MKILFVLKESTMHERLGIMYLSSGLKLHGHEVKLVLAEKIGLINLENIVLEYKPSLVGYSAMTGEHSRLLEVNKILKGKFNFIFVFGGPHVTFYPDFIHEESVDAICIGEGDIAFVEFCKRLEQKKDYWNTSNFIVKCENDIFKNSLLPLVKNLDEVAFPDRALMYDADTDLIDETKKTFFSARGCPYKCSYCFNYKYNEIYSGKGNMVRFRSPENLIEEICEVKKAYPLQFVHIDDDTFLLKPIEWFSKFGLLYKKRVSLPFSCNVRANMVREEIISVLRNAGLDSVWMGVECGDERVANEIFSRGLNNNQILKASSIIKKYGIKLVTQNILGIPVKNSFEIDIKTLDLNIKINPDFAWSSILYPYPSTPIGDYAKLEKYISNDSFYLETNKRSTIFNFSKQEKKYIENLHKLFGVIVQFPFLRVITKLLVKAPANIFYVSIFYLWYGYNFKFRLYPFKSVRKEILKYVILWLSVVKKDSKDVTDRCT